MHNCSHRVWSLLAFGLVGLLLTAEFVSAGFIYADGVATTGGQFNGDYPPSNLVNGGFTDELEVIDTRVNYLAARNNYASANGTTDGFALTFSFGEARELEAIYVWNYVFRKGGRGNGIENAGVRQFSLTFYDGEAGAGNVIGAKYNGVLKEASWNAENVAQVIGFGRTYSGVRSVVMQVISNHGGAFTGMNEVGFEEVELERVRFTSSGDFVQKPEQLTLSWEVEGEYTSLEIVPDVGDVLGVTVNGAGKVSISPVGEVEYRLVVDGVQSAPVRVIGLPVKEKVHLYLLIGQSNMQGAGKVLDPLLDSPNSRVLQFGSQNGMESEWVVANHPLTKLEVGGNAVGMGLEFGKSILAGQSDPEVVVGLINHAMGATAIQWWAPGAPHTKANRPKTSALYFLYDEAVARVLAAKKHGVVKGVLWHQGEYNSNNNSNPPPEPELYAGRLVGLVDNLRKDLGHVGLPFVCGKLVPESWVNDAGQAVNYSGLPYRGLVEAALGDLPNRRSNTFCVGNHGLRGMDDEMIHFDALSQRELGRRYAAAMLGFYKDPFKMYMGGFMVPGILQNDGLSGRNADFDGDGVSNFLEYKASTDPSDANSRPDVR